MQFKLIDRESWERNEYFEHYHSAVPCFYSMTVKLDITKQVQSGNKLYPMMLYCLATIVNRHEEFRMCFNSDGKLGVYNRLEPCYTVFHDDTETFSTVWTEYSDDYKTFCKAYQEDIEHYSAVKGFEAKANTPANVFNVSMIPWESFDGFNLNLPNGNDYLLPLFTIGKFYYDNGSCLLPLAIQVHHAVCDGFHTCRFINELRTLIENLDTIENSTCDFGESSDKEIIRVIEEKDIDIVAEIWLDSNIKAHDFIHADYWKSHFDSVRNMFLQSEVYVCESHNRILGFIGMNENYIEGIFVQEEARSHGIGKQLLDFIKSHKKQLSLSVYKKNARAVEFYQREGFEITECNLNQSSNEMEYAMVWHRV